MLLLNFGVSILALLALVHAQSEFHLTPNIAAVEQDINAGQEISSLEDLRNIIGISDPFSLEVEQESEASNGLRRQKLRLLYDGVPVRQVRLQASIDDNDYYTGAVSGYYPTGFPAYFDVSTCSSDSDLKSAIVDYMNANDNIPANVGSIVSSMLNHFTAEKQIDIDTNTGAPSLVYYVRAMIDLHVSTPGRYIRFPRALLRVPDLTPIKIDLSVLKASNSQNKRSCPKAQGGNDKFPEEGNVYGPGRHRVCLKAKKDGNTCTYKNNKIEIWTVDNTWDRSTAEIVSFTCSDGPDDEINGANSPSSDVFYYSQAFYRMLKRWTGLKSTHMEPIKMFVHFGDQYPNSFFDGKDITFGDGSSQTYPLTIPDAIGHELGHSLTDGLSNLQLSVEAVALNEAFSDICGKAVSVFETGENDWLFAKSFPKNDVALRYFYNPPLDGLAISHLDDFPSNQGVYSLMGIMTKFMHSVVAIEGIRYRDAFQAVVFANQIYWNEESSLIDGACGILRAASDMALDISAFTNAFDSVGIDLGFCDLSGTQDIITAQWGNFFVERRPTVSRFKNPIYVISPCAGVSYVQVHAAPSNGNADVTIFSDDNGVMEEYNGNDVVIQVSGNNNIIIGLKSNRNNDVDVEMSFFFY